MIVVLQDSNLPRFRSPPFRLRLCVHFCKALALLQISRFAKRHNKRSRRKPAPDIKAYQDKKASIHKVKSLMNTRYGAGGRTRTGTVSLPVDFESTTSANSITPAYSGATESLYPVQAKKSTLFLPNHIGNGIFEDIKSLFEGLLFYEQFGHHLDHSIPTAYTFHNQAVFEAFVQYFF